ncbi:MAG: SHOCT domain-containing protein [Candidatus Limivicinus sp.]
MTPEELRNDMLYHMALSMAKTMLEKGLLSPEEYVEIDTILLQKYQPYLGRLFSENTCYVSSLE